MSYSAVGTGVFLDMETSSTASVNCVSRLSRSLWIQQLANEPPAESVRLVVPCTSKDPVSDSFISSSGGGKVCEVVRTLSERTGSLRHLA